jgi:hypothetical protein
MHGFGSDAEPSAGQRTSKSPDYASPDSPRHRLIATFELSPRLLHHFPQYGDNENEEEDEDSEEGLLDDSFQGEFEGSSTEEIYDNSNKKFFYDSDNESDVINPNEDDDLVVYQSIEHDGEDGNQIIGESFSDNDNRSDEREARGPSAPQAEDPENLVKLSTSKLLASCLDTDLPFLHNYLTQRKTLAVQFLERNCDVVQDFLIRYPTFIEQFLRHNYQQALSLFADDPRWFIEDYLNKNPCLLENYQMGHPESVEKFINANPVYFDRYLGRHPEFAINYLHYNRLPSGYGISPDMFGVTSIVTPPPSAGLPSPDRSPTASPPPPPPAATEETVRKSTTRKHQATKSYPTKPASRSQQSLPKAAPAEAGKNTQQRPSTSAMALVSAPAPSKAKAPITPDSNPKKTAGSSRSKGTTVAATAAAAASSNSSAHAQTYKVLLTSAYGQTAGEFMDYPAPADLLAASRKQNAGTKGSWRLFEEDRAIMHMLDVRNEARLAGESRFEEVSTRLKAEGIERGFFAVKNYWNRTGRARSGFDERKNKTAPLATSKQGKAFKKSKKTKEQSKKKGKGVKADSEEEGEEKDDSEYSVHSEEEDTPPPPPPPPVSAPAPTPDPPKSAMKRPADYDDEALAWAMSYGTRPKKHRTG